LEGKPRVKKAIFLDRDGVINAMVYDPGHGLLDSPSSSEQFHLLPNVGEAIKLINEMGILALVVSNQPGVAKGRFSLQALEAMDQKMARELGSRGAHLDGVYYCLHHPQGIVEEYRQNCGCRKPEPGLLLRGSQEFKIALNQSYVIGDGLTDILAGKAVGAKTILLGRPKCNLCKLMDELNATPDFIAADLLEAVGLIQQMEGGEGDADLH